MVNALIKTLQAKRDKHHNYIFVTINDLIKDKKKKQKFFKHLGEYVEAEIKLEGFCNE
ncbi:hypothetical protein LCGC14_2368730 [marine sediment metagenome]|uniref:Uncharacterized protein n=1 Tax=marine sediment metagenome TaxID=412755 RepID=A0A0F9C4J9_9ZZZZ